MTGVMNIILLAVPAFVVSMLVEAAFLRSARSRARGDRGYEARDTAASLAMGAGNVVISMTFKHVTLAGFVWLYEHRLFDLGEGVLVWIAVFVAEDFCYYWFHRASHEVRLLWAAHVNHHSSERYNLSTALRQSWTTPVTGPLFWAPLPLLGFAPHMVVIAQAVSLLYQYWIHTETIRSLGPFEWLFNSPSHHRVHHGSDDLYLDRNHGGILIVWDRMFGTFQREGARPTYGIRKRLESYNPMTIAFHEWRALFADVRAARSLRAKLGTLFMPPGWRPDGTGLTSRRLRAALLIADRPALVPAPPTPSAAQPTLPAEASSLAPLSQVVDG